MKKWSIIICSAILLFLIVSVSLKTAEESPRRLTNAVTLEFAYQEDADQLRLEHIIYWSEILDEYFDKTNYYPFQDELLNSDETILIRIANKSQQQYFNVNSDQYAESLDFNRSNRFIEYSVHSFIAEIEETLGKEIFEKYDMQQVPTDSPIWYHLFITQDGYLIWTTVKTFGITKISTYLTLENAVIPTVNIGSANMVANVTKALTREDLLVNSIYQEWLGRGYYKEGYAREVEEKYRNDSKK